MEIKAKCVCYHAYRRGEPVCSPDIDRPFHLGRHMVCPYGKHDSTTLSPFIYKK